MLLWHFHTNEDSFGGDSSVWYQTWSSVFCAFLDCVRSAEGYLVPVPDFGGLSCNLFFISYFCLVMSTPTLSITKPQLGSPKCHGIEQSKLKKSILNSWKKLQLLASPALEAHQWSKKAHRDPWGTKVGALFHHIQYNNWCWKWEVANFIHKCIHLQSSWICLNDVKKLALREQLSKMYFKYLGVK